MINKKVFITFHGWETEYPVRLTAKLQRYLYSKLAVGSIHVGSWISKFYWDKPNFITYGGINSKRLTGVRKKKTPRTGSHIIKIAFSKIDLILIAVELFFIVHMFMGFLASTAVQQEAAALFLGGEYTAVFWGFFVFVGLIFPAIKEIMELYGYKIPISIPAFFILFGGALFRFIMVDAGQITRYLY